MRPFKKTLNFDLLLNPILRLPPWERTPILPRQQEQQQQMTRLTTELLTAAGVSSVIYVAGNVYFGLGVAGAWVGAITALGSVDGLNFNVPVDVQTYPSSVSQQTITANGNYFAKVGNLVAIQVTFTTKTSGTPQITMATSMDQSYADAFLTPQTISVSSAVNSGTNTLTQAANTNHGWNLTSLEVSFAGPGFGGGATLTVYDGTIAGNVLYSCWLTSPVGSVGSVQKINLPVDQFNNSAVQGTPGNAMTIVVLNAGNNASKINAGFRSS
jgi:hypothetical protein